MTKFLQSVLVLAPVAQGLRMNQLTHETHVAEKCLVTLCKGKPYVNSQAAALANLNKLKQDQMDELQSKIGALQVPTLNLQGNPQEPKESSMVQSDKLDATVGSATKVTWL